MAIRANRLSLQQLVSYMDGIAAEMPNDGGIAPAMQRESSLLAAAARRAAATQPATPTGHAPPASPVPRGRHPLSELKQFIDAIPTTQGASSTSNE